MLKKYIGILLDITKALDTVDHSDKLE